MLSADENRVLTQVNAGTLMGDLMRRYWMPVAAVAELNDNPIKLVRFMGEDLVLYKDKSATFGLVDRHYPHRRADMSYGILEDCGLRCNYHGWLFDETGTCLAQPFEKRPANEPAARLAARRTRPSEPEHSGTDQGASQPAFGWPTPGHFRRDGPHLGRENAGARIAPSRSSGRA